MDDEIPFHREVPCTFCGALYDEFYRLASHILRTCREAERMRRRMFGGDWATDDGGYYLRLAASGSVPWSAAQGGDEVWQ